MIDWCVRINVDIFVNINVDTEIHITLGSICISGYLYRYLFTSR